MYSVFRNTRIAPETRPVSQRERAFVRSFRYRSVRWSGKRDMEGLQLLGDNQGFRITRDKDSGRLCVQALDVDGTRVIPTNRVIFLRERDSLENLIPGLRPWVA